MRTDESEVARDDPRAHGTAAQRALSAVLAGERLPWPEALPLYAERLIELVIACATPTGKAEVLQWLIGEHGDAHAPRLRPPTLDATHDAIVEIAALLLRVRAGLDPARRPNLRVALRRHVWWRAHDSATARRRHHQRQVTGRIASEALAAAPAPDDVFTSALARDIWRRLGESGQAGAALRMVGLGASVTEAARRCGVSRQAVYRLRRQLSEVVGRSER